MEEFISFVMEGIADILSEVLGEKFSARFKAAVARSEDGGARSGRTPRSPRLMRRADLPGYVAPASSIAEQRPGESGREDSAS